MKKSRRFAVLACCCLLCATAFLIAVWWPAPRPGSRIPVRFIAFTAKAETAHQFAFADTNLIARGYATFRISNPTSRSFLCYPAPIFHDDGQADLHHGWQPDFHLQPGEEVTFSVPVPDWKVPWRCGVVLGHIYSRPAWKTQVLYWAERLRLVKSETTWFAVSPEVVTPATALR